MNAPAMLEPATGVRERKDRRAPGLRATLGPFLHPYRASLLAAAGLSVLQSASELAQPWPLALAVDYAVGRPRLTGALAGLGSLSPVSFALLAAGMSVVLVGVGGLMGYLVEYLSGAAGARIGSDIRVAAFGRLQSLALPFHDRNRSAQHLPETQLVSQLKGGDHMISSPLGTPDKKQRKHRRRRDK